MKPSRPVTRRCVVCEARFKTKRRDSVYCSGKCRQRACRARQDVDEIDREITDARRRYWELVRAKAEGTGQSLSQVLTAQSQFVDQAGNVFMGGGPMGGIGHGRELVGRVAPRPGWDRWGLEAAGAPFAPPMVKR